MATRPFPLHDNSLACSYKQTVLRKVSLQGFRRQGFVGAEAPQLLILLGWQVTQHQTSPLKQGTSVILAHQITPPV